MEEISARMCEVKEAQQLSRSAGLVRSEQGWMVRGSNPSWWQGIFLSSEKSVPAL